MSLLQRIWAALGGEQSHGRERRLPNLSTAPHRPVSFGYKICWLAVRTENGAAVGDALGLFDRRPTNWETGIAAAYAYDLESEGAGVPVFITPPVDGWTLAVGWNLPFPAEAGNKMTVEAGRRFQRLFSILASRFDEVQFFGTHRVSGCYAWARARHGGIERVYSFMDDGIVSEGFPTSEELALGFHRNPNAAGDYWDLSDFIPSEADVIALARAWSIDPTTLDDRPVPLGNGFIGYLPTS
jgi:hypothetical protein